MCPPNSSTMDVSLQDLTPKPDSGDNTKLHSSRTSTEHRVHEYTLKELAAYLGLHDSTIHVIAKRVDEELSGQE
jgi:hypothetical protein